MLKFIEPQTNIEVTLIGTMHFNPHSIDVTRREVEQASKRKSLSSIIVESCPTRWNTKTNSITKWLLPNEMRAASDSVSQDVKLILGDQPIEKTTTRLKESFVESVSDLLNPFGLYPPNSVAPSNSDERGIKRLYKEVSNAMNESKWGDGEDDEEKLTYRDFLDPQLLLSAPASLVRYPLSILLKAPKVGIPLLLGLGIALSSDGGSSAFAIPFMNMGTNSIDLGSAATSASVSASSSELVNWLVQQSTETLTSAAISALELALLARPFLVVLLQERNKILAENIREACKVAAEERKRSGDANKEVIAVLGMAHINGVAARLKGQIL